VPLRFQSNKLVFPVWYIWVAIVYAGLAMQAPRNYSLLERFENLVPALIMGALFATLLDVAFRWIKQVPCAPEAIGFVSGLLLFALSTFSLAPYGATRAWLHVFMLCLILVFVRSLISFARTRSDDAPRSG
jgi:hypothetical protein